MYLVHHKKDGVYANISFSFYPETSVITSTFNYFKTDFMVVASGAQSCSVVPPGGRCRCGAAETASVRGPRKRSEAGVDVAQCGCVRHGVKILIILIKTSRDRLFHRRETERQQNVQGLELVAFRRTGE